MPETPPEQTPQDVLKPEAPPQPAVLTITMQPDGKINVNFPQNAMVVTHMLYEARKLLDRWFAEAQTPKILPASVVPVHGANGKGGLIHP